MDNSYFIYSNSAEEIEIERFHICTWEFKNNKAFVEFGFEISSKSVEGKDGVELELVVPWLTKGVAVHDFYNKLKDAQNSRFIFNDNITATRSLDEGQDLNGVIHEFKDRNKLCLLPFSKNVNYDNHSLTIKLDFRLYNKFNHLGEGDEAKPTIYVRFSLSPPSFISTQKKGITKSTILYDIKLNQKRNMPEQMAREFTYKRLCDVKICFCFNIIPNSYDLAFFDSSTLQNVRTLEYDSFKRYIGEDRFKRDDLLVVFNKNKDGNHAFFSIYTKEHIGTDQLAIALAVSLIAGILLFIPSYQVSLNDNKARLSFFQQMPLMFWLVVGLILFAIITISWSRIRSLSLKIWKP